MKIKFFTLGIFLGHILLGAAPLRGPDLQKQEAIASPSSSSALNNPLQKLNSFAFFAYYDPRDGKNYDEIQKLIVKELEKVGTVIQTKKEGSKEAIDVSGFASGALLNFEIKNISTLDQKKVQVMNASLRLSSPVKIQKTAVSCFADTWSASCFLEGSFEKTAEKAIAKSLETLLGKFMANYHTANPKQQEKPVFYLYSP